MTGQDNVAFDETQRGERPFRFDVLALLLLVFLTHFVRLGVVPVIGEEGRRARSAINMIETGDWIVVQNQGVVFPDRPPMISGTFASTGGRIFRFISEFSGPTSIPIFRMGC